MWLQIFTASKSVKKGLVTKRKNYKSLNMKLKEAKKVSVKYQKI